MTGALTPSRKELLNPIHLQLPIDEMALEQSTEAKENQWTLMQHSKEDIEMIGSIMDLTMALYQQKITVLCVVSWTYWGSVQN